MLSVTRSAERSFGSPFVAPTSPDTALGDGPTVSWVVLGAGTPASWGAASSGPAVAAPTPACDAERAPSPTVAPAEVLRLVVVVCAVDTVVGAVVGGTVFAGAVVAGALVVVGALATVVVGQRIARRGHSPGWAAPAVGGAPRKEGRAGQNPGGGHEPSRRIQRISRIGVATLPWEP